MYILCCNFQSFFPAHTVNSNCKAYFYLNAISNIYDYNYSYNSISCWNNVLPSITFYLLSYHNYHQIKFCHWISYLRVSSQHISDVDYFSIVKFILYSYLHLINGNVLWNHSITHNHHHFLNEFVYCHNVME